jgi:hypothetical protein
LWENTKEKKKKQSKQKQELLLLLLLFLYFSSHVLRAGYLSPSLSRYIEGERGTAELTKECVCFPAIDTCREHKKQELPNEQPQKAGRWHLFPFFSSHRKAKEKPNTRQTKTATAVVIVVLKGKKSKAR